jgi:NADPH-dependent F420 reductase
MDIKELTVGLLGGTGPEGRGLALRWAMAGAKVTIGSRSLDRARAAADELNRRIGSPLVGGGENQAVARESEFVLISIPFEHAAPTVQEHQGDFAGGAILIDATVPLAFEKGRVRYVELPEGSSSERLRAVLKPEIALVAAFKTMPAHLLEDPHEPLDCDEFVAGDDRDAKARVIEAMGSIQGLRPLDAGALENARTLERMTVLAIGINRRNKVKTARYRVVGL